MKAPTELLKNLRAKRPLIHHLTNVVTVNDCANMTLALGGAPVMTEDDGDALEMAGYAGALVINMGTLDARSLGRMIEVGRKARGMGKPVVFDPVGAGATKVRREAALRILTEVKPTIVKGNAAEILFLAGAAVAQKGVDADASDDAAKAVGRLAQAHGCVVAATGPIDYVSDGKHTARLEGGDGYLARITGTGCMTASLTGCCAAAEGDAFAAAVYAILCMKVAGEKAAGALAPGEGVGHFRIRLLDAVSLLHDGDLRFEGRVYDV
ncbi:MAG: hydroxyethylthiazole kinase [Spirochaetes bacterium]|nr:hydroxyethylthiazole kinase [Spirochaetota bacterium]